jgi:RNA recognition motif-containing protein
MIAGKKVKVDVKPESPPIKNDRRHINDQCNVYVCGFPLRYGKADVDAMFAPFGTICNSRILMNEVTGQCRGVGFVRFDNPDSASNAIQSLNGKVIGDATEAMQVRLASPTVSDSKRTSQQGMGRHNNKGNSRSRGNRHSVATNLQGNRHQQSNDRQNNSSNYNHDESVDGSSSKSGSNAHQQQQQQFRQSASTNFHGFVSASYSNMQSNPAASNIGAGNRNHSRQRQQVSSPSNDVLYQQSQRYSRNQPNYFIQQHIPSIQMQYSNNHSTRMQVPYAFHSIMPYDNSLSNYYSEVKDNHHQTGIPHDNHNVNVGGLGGLVRDSGVANHHYLYHVPITRFN